MKPFTLSRKDYATGLLITLTYLTLSLYFVNYRLILQTLFDTYPLTYKATLLFSLATGTWQILPWYEFILISITAILVGTNIALITKLLKRIKSQGKLKLSTGSTSLLAIAGVGCPSCGVSVLSVLGISSSAFPVRGVTLQLITLGLLLLSLTYNIKKLRQPQLCPLPNAREVK